MIRLPLIIAGGVVAAAAAVTPAVVGLTGNPSFSQQVPVRVPAHASVATFPTGTASAHWHDQSIERGDIEPRHREVPHRPAIATPLASPRGSASEPGEDRGRGQQPERGDDRGRGRGDSPTRSDRSESSDRSAAGSGGERGGVEDGRRGGDDDGRR